MMGWKRMRTERWRVMGGWGDELSHAMGCCLKFPRSAGITQSAQNTRRQSVALKL